MDTRKEQRREKMRTEIERFVATIIDPPQQNEFVQEVLRQGIENLVTALEALMGEDAYTAAQQARESLKDVEFLSDNTIVRAIKPQALNTAICCLGKDHPCPLSVNGRFCLGENCQYAIQERINGGKK